MKEIKIIGFDLDDVVIDTMGAIREEIKTGDISLFIKEFKEYKGKINAKEKASLVKKYPILLEIFITGLVPKNIKEEDIMKLAEEDEAEYPCFTKFLLESNWWKDILKKAKPVEGAVDALGKIPGEKVFASRRLIGDLEAIIKWFKKNSTEILKENIHLRPDLNVSEIKHKKSIIEKYGIEVFYDDLKRVVKKIPQAKLFEGWSQVKKDLKI
ncbi:hypothetical protein AMJ49_04030 [Parcubacteria bacterium DG_74_2]|nr:MAG: hypothetical protein AMJ49_04030 [Parcubacteria bacterium DG_74_2]